MRALLRLPFVLALTAALLAAGTAAFAPRIGEVVSASDSTREDLELKPLAQRSIVYDRYGNILATFHAEENREEVTLDQVPEQVQQAILAVEDENFYDHGGFNMKSSARALFENVSAGGIEQGGSTITMQLVKNLILTPEQEIDRKVKEIILAIQLEDQMEKDEILEMYLNTVYFGGGAYGVQAAAEIYWQKDVEELDWPEAALLAGMIANPSAFDPVVLPDAARERRAVVLNRLVQVDAIEEFEARQYNAVALPTSLTPVLPPPDDYFVEAVKEELLADPMMGASYQERENALFRGGLQIYTTIDPIAQAQAEQTRIDVIGAFGEFTAAMVGIEPSSGAVRVMVGGPGFEHYQYNIATHSPGRQTGSSFKTLVLLAALEAGAVPSDQIAGGGDFPNPGGTPNPYERSGRGGTLTSITLGSSNGAYVRLGQIIGLDEVVDLAHRLGVDTPLDPTVVSLPLGTVEMPLFELTSAYTAVAYGGIRQDPYMVERIEDSLGNIVFERKANTTRPISRQTACLATQILHANTTGGGTGTRAFIGEQPVAGKTGTTDENSDALFVGFSPYLTFGVWMGNELARVPMVNVGQFAQVEGGTYPAMMFSDFMTKYHQELPVIEFGECEPVRRGEFLKLGNETIEQVVEGGEFIPFPDLTPDEPDEPDDPDEPTPTTDPTDTTSPGPTTTLPSTTAPVTTAPVTTAPVTTAPPTTSPPTTSPPTTSP